MYQKSSNRDNKLSDEAVWIKFFSILFDKNETIEENCLISDNALTLFKKRFRHDIKINETFADHDFNIDEFIKS